MNNQRHGDPCNMRVLLLLTVVFASVELTASLPKTEFNMEIVEELASDIDSLFEYLYEPKSNFPSPDNLLTIFNLFQSREDKQLFGESVLIAGDMKKSLLCLAVEYGHVDLVKALLAVDVRVPAEIHTLRKSSEISQMLKQSKSRIVPSNDNTYNDSLLKAIGSNWTEGVKNALKNGANPNMKLENGFTLIDFSTTLENTKIFDLLMDFGFNNFFSQDVYGNCLLERMYLRYYEKFLYLVFDRDDEIPLFANIIRGQSLLETITFHRNYELIKNLMERKPKYFLNVYPERLIDFFHFYPALKSTRFRLGETFYHFEARKGILYVNDLELSDIYAKDAFGYSILDKLIENENWDLVSLLLKKIKSEGRIKAVLSCRDSNGRSLAQKIPSHVWSV